MRRKLRVYIIVLLALFMVLLLPAPPKTCAQNPAAVAPAELRISGAVTNPLVLTVADLKRMPRKTLSVLNPHEKRPEAYEGVLLEEILRRAGVPLGEQMRGSSMATYVIVEAEDGYRVVFSLAELASGIIDSEVIVADTMEGAPLAAKQGPFKLVAPHEKRLARWVRMLKTVTVVRAPAQYGSALNSLSLLRFATGQVSRFRPLNAAAL